MGGKTGTTSSTTKIPPEVMARYEAVNKRAEEVAAKPFQQYGTTPDQFVAQLNQQQKTGQAGMNQYANAAQPVLNQVQQGYTPEGFSQGVKGYMNPYLESAVASTRNQMQNVAGQQQAQMKGSAIGQGAFGGDRSNIGMGNLINQQNLALGQTIGGMESQGFQNAAQNYMSGLGQRGQTALAAQQAGLQGAQAQIGAGTLGQQTEQAGKTALYNQFLQEQAYPYQVAQFLANIAMGTGALSGSSTTTTQPMPFFSDERLKDDIEKIGKTFDGQDIIKFRYKGEDGPKQIGLSAQNVEKHHPEAVGLAKGYKTVDYDAATKDAAKRGHFEEGGLVSEGGAVGMQHMGQGFASGGGAYDPYDPYSIYNILSRQQGFFEGGERSHVPTARGLSGGIGKHGRVPEASLPVGRLMTPDSAPPIPESLLKQGLGTATDFADLATKGKDLYKFYKDLDKKEEARGGLVGYAAGGMPYDLDSDPKKLDIPDDTSKFKMPEQKHLPGAMQDPTMKAIMDMAKLASGFMKNGGRAGYATDGAVDESSPEYWKNYSIESAKRAGHKDPQFAAKVYHGESGFNPLAEGDDKSSYGIAQLHYGNTSKQFSKPGLGDEFTKQTGFDLRDPEVRKNPDVIRASIDWSNDYAAKNGWKPWTVARKLMGEGDLPAKNATPSADVGEGGLNPPKSQSMIDRLAESVGFSKSSAQDVKGKNREGPDSTDLLLSVLGGVGTMASSNSPYLGAALLQGLGGGAKTYAGLRGQSLERGLAQQGIDITGRTQGIQALKYLQDRFEPLMDATGSKIIGYRDLNGGEVSVEEYGRIMSSAANELNLSSSITGLGGAEKTSPSGTTEVGGEGLGGAGKVIEGGGTIDEGGLGSVGEKPVAEEKTVDLGEGKIVPLSYLSDPAVIQSTIEKLNRQLGVARGAQADVIKGEIEKLNNVQLQIASVANTIQTVYDPQTGQKIGITGVDYLKGLADAAESGTPGEFTYKGQKVVTGEDPTAKANVDMFNDQLKESNNFVRSWKSDLRPRLISLAGIYQQWKGAGRGSQGFAQLNDFMRNIFGIKGFDAEAAPNFDAAAKDAMLIAIARTNEFAKSAPATGGEMAMVTVPDPEKNPDALYKNITDAIGYGDLGYKRSSEFIKNKPRDVSVFNMNFGENPENNADLFKERARKEIKPFAGSNPKVLENMGLGTPKEPVIQDDNTVAIPPNTPNREVLRIIRETPKGVMVILPDGREIQGEKE